MNRFISTVAAAAVLALSSLAVTTPVSAASLWQPNYYPYQNHHRYDNGFGRYPAAGLFGFMIGAPMNGMTGHVGACENRYRSYDARTDTFLGHDGLRHACRLY